MQESIKKKLLEIEEKYNIDILFAVELGSRVWGYALPDSDYDVRFVFRHRIREYLKISGYKEVIEIKEDKLDIVGYDVQKALSMAYGTSVSILEMCLSDIVYCETQWFAEFFKIVKQYSQPKRMLYHYIGMAGRKLYEAERKTMVNPKDYLLVCRTLLAGKMVAKGKMPLLSISDLMEEVAGDELFDKIEMLLGERCNGQMVPVDKELKDIIERELEELEKVADKMGFEKKDYAAIDEFFIKLVKGRIHELLFARLSDEV